MKVSVLQDLSFSVPYTQAFIRKSSLKTQRTQILHKNTRIILITCDTF